MIEKGTVSSIKGGKAIVSTADGLITPELSIPKIFQYEVCCECEYCTECLICDKIAVGNTVVFALFEDNTGAVLQKI